MGSRLNVQVSEKVNKWLGEESEERALSKSTIVNLAIQEYMEDRENLYANMREMYKDTSKK